MDNAKIIVDQIYKNGFYVIENYFNESDFINLKKDAFSKFDQPIMRHFNHKVYKRAVNDRTQSLLLSIAMERAKRESRERLDPKLLKTQISISFPKKGKKFGNEKISKLAFHYDDSYVSGVLPLELPEEKGGLLIYKNLRLNRKNSIILKIFTRILNRIKLLTLLFKPLSINYDIGNLYLFFSDISLHGVDKVLMGERISLTLNMSRVTYKTGYKLDKLKKNRSYANGYEFLLK